MIRVARSARDNLWKASRSYKNPGTNLGLNPVFNRSHTRRLLCDFSLLGATQLKDWIPTSVSHTMRLGMYCAVICCFKGRKGYADCLSTAYIQRPEFFRTVNVIRLLSS